MHVPSYDALQIGNEFLVSVWFHGESFLRNNPRIVSRKHVYTEDGGFEICLNNTGALDIRGGSSTCTALILLPNYSNNWIQVSFAFVDEMVTCYTNGSMASSFEAGVIAAPTDNGLPLAFGNHSDGTGLAPSFYGQYDEIRLRGGSLSADRIKADYDMIANRSFLGYGDVKNVK